MMLEWVAIRFKNYRTRRRMRSRAKLLVQAGALKPEILSYLESLEFRVDRQDKELRLLRWSLEGEQMANWDLVQDVLNARIKREDGSVQAD